MKTFLIINPNSGPFHKRKTIPRIILILRQYFPGLEIAYTRNSGDASALVKHALHRGTETILCAGGDGTINEVANQLQGTTVCLGVIPIGTGNGLAREIGISTNPIKAIRQIVHGRVVPIFPGEMNHRIFLMVSGAGFDGFVSQQVDRYHPQLKKRTGYLSYILIGTMMLWKYRFPSMTVKIDENFYHCYGILVLKAKAKIGPLTLAPSLSLENPQIAAFVFKKRGGWSILSFLLAFLLRVHLRRSACPFIPCTRIEAESDDPVPTQVDGEEGHPFPVTWKKSDKQIFLIYPQGEKNEL